MDAIREIVTRLGYLFYVVSPSETTFQHITEIPNYVSDVRPDETLLIHHV